VAKTIKYFVTFVKLLTLRVAGTLQ